MKFWHIAPSFEVVTSFKVCLVYPFFWTVISPVVFSGAGSIYWPLESDLQLTFLEEPAFSDTEAEDTGVPSEESIKPVIEFFIIFSVFWAKINPIAIYKTAIGYYDF